MVTESVAYIGTSNWSADYFLYTGGIGYVINETENSSNVRAQLQAVFERNWYSNFTTPIYDKDWISSKPGSNGQIALWDLLVPYIFTTFVALLD